MVGQEFRNMVVGYMEGTDVPGKVLGIGMYNTGKVTADIVIIIEKSDSAGNFDGTPEVVWRKKHMNLWSAAHLKEDFEKNPCKKAMQIEAEGTKPDERYIKLYNSAVSAALNSQH